MVERTKLMLNEIKQRCAMRLVRALCKAAPNAMGSALATLDKSQQPADAAADAPETDSEEESDNDRWLRAFTCRRVS